MDMPQNTTIQTGTTQLYPNRPLNEEDVRRIIREEIRRG